MTAESVFLSLLRTSLWGGRANVPADFAEWGKVFSLAKTQSVLALVANAVINDEELVSLLPDRYKDKLKSSVLVNFSTHQMLNSTLIQVVNILNGAGITSVLLKGQGIARNYSVPELRTCGDIDIYVGSENYLKSCELLSAIASWKEESDPSENGKHYDIRIGKITVEIHRFSDVNASSYYDKIYQKYSDDGLTNHSRVLDFAGTEVNTPEDTFNAFYIFNHLWHHFMTSGVGLRQFCDWMLFLHNHKDDIDLDKLRRIIDDMDLMKPWQAFGCVLVDVLGMPAEEFPFYDARQSGKVKRIMKHVLTEGNFGHERAFFKGRQSEGYFKRKVKSLWLHTSRSIQLFFLFPSHVIRQFWNTLTSGIRAVWKDKVKK